MLVFSPPAAARLDSVQALRQRVRTLRVPNVRRTDSGRFAALACQALATAENALAHRAYQVAADAVEAARRLSCEALLLERRANAGARTESPQRAPAAPSHTSTRAALAATVAQATLDTEAMTTRTTPTITLSNLRTVLDRIESAKLRALPGQVTIPAGNPAVQSNDPGQLIAEYARIMRQGRANAARAGRTRVSSLTAGSLRYRGL